MYILSVAFLLAYTVYGTCVPIQWTETEWSEHEKQTVYACTWPSQ